MMWSFSAHGSFRRCARQWFYKKTYGNSRAKDPLRREAHRLSKLEGIQAWRGKVVDTVISETIIPSITWKHPCSLDNAKKKADQLFALQRPQHMVRNGENTFFEIEYGLPLTEEMFANARVEIHTALENLYKAEAVWTRVNQAKALIPQRTLSFKHGDVTVQVRPDLIAFRQSLTPVIFDWKVNVRPMRDYWLQLVTGAIALTRCTPHRDWSKGTAQHSPQDIELLEVQLLIGDIRLHRASPAEVEGAEDFISASATDMQFACSDEDTTQLRPEDFPVTNDPRICQTCPFRKLCWGVVQ